MRTSFIFDQMANPGVLKAYWETPGMMYAYLMREFPIPSGRETTMRRFTRFIADVRLLTTLPVVDDVYDAEDVTFEKPGTDMVHSVIIVAGAHPAIFLSEISGFPVTPWKHGSLTVQWDDGPGRIFDASGGFDHLRKTLPRKSSASSDHKAHP